MSHQVAPDEKALQAGADLWIIADLEKSAWAQKIDWYLNFQILRSKTHKTPIPSPELLQVLERWEIEAPAVEELESAPLMIASADRLPNHAVVVVPFDDEDPRRWVKRVHDTWTRLDSPGLRIFLPEGLAASRFQEAWPGPADILSHALVPDSSRPQMS